MLHDLRGRLESLLLPTSDSFLPSLQPPSQPSKPSIYSILVMSLSNAAESTHNLLIRVQRANSYNLRSPRKLVHGQPRESASNSMDFLPSYAEALSDTRLELYPSLRAEPSNTSSSSILPSVRRTLLSYLFCAGLMNICAAVLDMVLQCLNAQLQTLRRRNYLRGRQHRNTAVPAMYRVASCIQGLTFNSRTEAGQSPPIRVSVCRTFS